MLKIGVVVERWDFADMATRGHDEAMKIIGTEIMQKYANEDLYERFTSRREQRELRFKSRERGYNLAKVRRRKGGLGVMDHVWSGDTGKTFSRTARVNVQKGRGSSEMLWRIVVSGLGPQYSRRKSGSERIDLRAEIERITPADADAAVAYAGQRYVEVITSPRLLRKRSRKYA